MGSKKLCTWDKDRIREKRETLLKQVAQPKYLCVKCARVARDKERLCKPVSLQDT